MQAKRRRTIYWVIGIVGLILVWLAAWQIRAANEGVKSIHLEPGGLPMVILMPVGAEPGTRPLVLIGHGFAGSEVVMRGFALTLAKAGYVAAAWDFDGHGQNPHPWQSNRLVQNAEQALDEVQRQGLADTHHVAILGHSMGSGVALTFGQDHPDTAATIAVSPVGRSVTSELPHNLLLMAGSLEPEFVYSAEQRLAEAGGPGGDPTAGTARKLVVIPGVEHISILFSQLAYHTALQWLNDTFGVQPGAKEYTDHRILWYGLGVIGVLLIILALSPLVVEATLKKRPKLAAWRWLLALIGGSLGATLALWLASKAGLGLQNLLGLLVGGYLVIWFGLAGVISWLLSGRRTGWPTGKALLGGLLVFGGLWLGVGLLGNFVWLPWLLIARRLILWPLASFLLLPWFLTMGGAFSHASGVGKFGWWLVQSAILVSSLFLALSLNSELGFLTLILPLFPIILGLHALAVALQWESWAYALSGALFTSWILLAVFPLQ